MNFVSYWNSCRFANWLVNGQKTGAQDASTTERGAYTLDGYNGNDGRTIQRNAGATWAVTSEDEWYKAAYYDPNKAGGAGYWLYPTRSDTAPANQVLSTDPGNSANYYIYFPNGYPNAYGISSIGSPYYRTNVGEFENSASAYGTFDQGGNVREWTEGIVAQGVSGLDTYVTRATRGGSCFDVERVLRASFIDDNMPTSQAAYFGFRVSYVPEPSSIIALLGGLVGLLGIRRRKA